MHRYIMTSNSTEGEVEIVYVEGIKRRVDTIGFKTSSRKALDALFSILPINEGDIPAFVADYNKLYKPNTIKIDRADLEISFDDFWDAYAKKINRKRCEPLWKKLSLPKRMKAFNRIKDYNRYLDRSGIAKLDPENYLRDERFEDEGW